MNPLEAMLQHNQNFAQHFDPSLARMAGLKNVVLACADPRVDPVEVLGLERRESLVLRNLGGRVNPAFWQTLAMLQTVARVDGAMSVVAGRVDVIVLQHTDCGITRLAERRDLLAGFFGVSEEAVDAKTVTDPYAAVAEDVAALRANPNLPPTWVVTGLVYDVHSGRAEIAVTSDPAGS